MPQEIDFSKYPLPKRWRHHVQPNIYFPYNDKNPNKESYPPLIQKIDWKTVFKNGKNPNCIDIGAAWSRFLLKYAIQNPNENILGLEVRKQTIDYAEIVANSENIRNASFLWYSVVNGLDFIDEKSIQKVFYFFPDPWFKEKHKKRRAFNQKFLDDVYRVLEKEGRLYLQTDIFEIHQYHLENLKSFGKLKFWEPSLQEWNLPTTDKEEECIRKKFDYWRIICQKD